MIQINAFYSDRIGIELIFLNIHFKISKSWPIQYSLSYAFHNWLIWREFPFVWPWFKNRSLPNFEWIAKYSHVPVKYFSNISDHWAVQLVHRFKLWFLLNFSSLSYWLESSPPQFDWSRAPSSKQQFESMTRVYFENNAI